MCTSQGGGLPNVPFAPLQGQTSLGPDSAGQSLDIPFRLVRMPASSAFSVAQGQRMLHGVYGACQWRPTINIAGPLPFRRVEVAEGASSVTNQKSHVLTTVLCHQHKVLISDFLWVSSTDLSHCRIRDSHLPLEVPENGTSPARTMPRDLCRRSLSTSMYLIQRL